MLKDLILRYVLMGPAEAPASSGTSSTETPSASSQESQTSEVHEQDGSLTEDNAGDDDASAQGDNWDALAQDEETDDAQTAQTTVEPPAQERPAEAKPVEPPKGQEPATTQIPAPAEAPKKEEPAGKTAQELEAEARAAAERQEKELVEFYKFPDEVVARLETDGATVLPELAAKLHMTVLNNVMQQVQANLPAFIHQYQTVTQTEQRARDTFFGVNQDLKDVQGIDDLVYDLGVSYRKAHRDAAPEDVAKAVGAMVRAGLSMPPVAATTTTPKPATPGTASAKPRFVPATPGGSTAAPAPVSSNEFEKMAEEFLTDDAAP